MSGLNGRFCPSPAGMCLSPGSGLSLTAHATAGKVETMTTDPDPSRGDEGLEETTSEPGSPSITRAPRVTRASAAWVATGVALLLLVLLVVFMLQNTTKVEVRFLGMSGTVPLGMALLIAAVGGGVVVGMAGVARVTQLRLNARRIRRNTPSS